MHKAFAAPTLASPLGFTPLGQAVHEQIFAGAGQTLSIAVAALLGSLLLSLLFAGLNFIAPRILARSFAALIDAWLAIPGIFIALSIGYFLPQGFISVIIALVLSEFAALQKYFLQRLDQASENDFIVMANAMGASRGHLLARHILPRLLRESRYMFFVTLPSIVLSLASLEFLGVQTGSERLSLGMQIAIYKDYILLYPHLSLAPVVALILLLLVLSQGSRLIQKS